MEKSKELIATLIALIGTQIGGFDMLFKTLIIFNFIDIILGVTLSGIKKDWASSEMWEGGKRKAIIWVVVLVATYLGILFEFKEMRDIVIYYYIAMEGLSILEHVQKSNIPLPKFLKSFLEILRDNTSEGNKND